ncbi:HipA N-terminal domain-containing protein [bacterium]|nr:HipA N-terminal domain-containing protein [bacterium]
MRRVRVLVHGRPAAVLEEVAPGREYRLQYDPGYDGPPVSLALPVSDGEFTFDRFPPFFDGLLPEGVRLEALLRQAKIDAADHLSQLLAVGGDLVGAVTVEAVE